MISAGFEGTQILKDQWDEIYGGFQAGNGRALFIGPVHYELEVETFKSD